MSRIKERLMKKGGKDHDRQEDSSGLHGAPSRTPSATSTETTPPLALVPASELNNIAANSTINTQTDLFKIVTLINLNPFYYSILTDCLLIQYVVL